jgi:putative transposase
MSMIERLCAANKCELINFWLNQTKSYLGGFFTKCSYFTLVNTIKTITSREIRKEFREELKSFPTGIKLWKRGYYFIDSGQLDPHLISKSMNISEA